MNKDERRHLRQQLITGVSEVVPDNFTVWAESVDPLTEKVNVRISLEVSAEVSDKALAFLCDDPAAIGRVIGDQLRVKLGDELRKVLRNHYGH